MTAEEARVKLGAADLLGIPWINHACSDERNLRYLGTTSRGTYVSLKRHLSEADLIIAVGAIYHSFYAPNENGLPRVLAGEQNVGVRQPA